MLDLIGTMQTARQGPSGIARLGLLHLLAALCLLPVGPEASATSVKTIQSYAGSLLTPLEFSSALVLWHKESSWNIRAVNGSHHGLCQGRSTYMAKANYKQQVRWCIAYAYNRYGSITKALDHWRAHGWH